MGNLNFQDVLRDVHDPSLHALQTTASLSASTIYVGNPTLYAVVNTGAAGDSTANIGFATVAVSTPTLYAVVNTGAAGVGNSMVTINPRTDYFGLVSVSGNVAVSSLPALAAGVNNIGFASVTPVAAWPDPKTYIGLVTVGHTVTVAAHALTASTVNIGSVSVLGGTINAGLNAGVNGIGFATINVVNQPALVASSVNIGSVSILGGGIGLNTGLNSFGFATVAVSTPTLYAVVNTGAVGVGNSMVTINPRTDYFGLVSVSGNVVLGTSTLNIGSVSVLGGSVVANLNTGTLNIGSVSVLGGTINSTLQTSTLNVGSVSVLGGSIGINAGINGIGFATVSNAIGTQFIGLVTAVTRNAGTNKALVNLPIAFSTASITTVVTPSTSNTIYVTNLLLNSNATVRVTLKSGVTYLTGNASIGVTLNPGGGLVMTGSPDSPSWIGLPSGAFVVEKLDLTATSAQIAGNVVYFQE